MHMKVEYTIQYILRSMDVKFRNNMRIKQTDITLTYPKYIEYTCITYLLYDLFYYYFIILGRNFQQGECVIWGETPNDMGRILQVRKCIYRIPAYIGACAYKWNTAFWGEIKILNLPHL